MGTHNRKSRNRRLADMSEAPDSRIYEPPEAAIEDRPYLIYLSSDDELVVKHVWHQGRCVDFAIVLRHRYRGEWHEVARIDCSGGTVHRHVYNRRGEEIVNHDVIQEIDPERGAVIVDTLFQQCIDRMIDTYEENLRRWREG